jgi:hypothetical protein
MQIKPILARAARAAVPIVLLAGGFLAIVCRPPNRMCRIVPAASDIQQNHLKHVAKNSASDGFRVISPSIVCGRCHDPKAHTIIP